MIIFISIICFTIFVCYLIRYICIWNCQKIEYKLYKEKNNLNSPYIIRPYFYENKENSRKSTWGYVIYDTTTELPWLGAGGSKNFTIFYDKESATARLYELNELYGY